MPGDQGDGAVSIFHSDFWIGSERMGFIRALRHPEDSTDLSIGLSLGEPEQNIALPPRQPPAGAGTSPFVKAGFIRESLNLRSNPSRRRRAGLQPEVRPPDQRQQQV